MSAPPTPTEITAAMVLEYIAVGQSTAEHIAVYANHRFGGLLPVDARRESDIGTTTGGQCERALRILCARLGLSAPRGPKRSWDFPDYARAGLSGRHQRHHIERGVTSPDCPLCGQFD